MQPPIPNLFIPLIIMSGLNRLFVPDLGDQANLMPLYQSRQADVFAWRDDCHQQPREMEGKTEGKTEGGEGRRGGGREGGM